MLTFRCTVQAFEIDLPAERFDQLVAAEDRVRANGELYPAARWLFAKLDDLDGVGNIGYDEEFGKNVSLTIDTDVDTPELRAEILALIEAHIDWCASILTADPAGSETTPEQADD